MAYPSTVYAATAAAGVYVSRDFGGPLATMPTWAAVNGGLSSLTLLCFCLDRSETPWDTRMFLIDSNYDLYRRTTGDWAVALSNADARTATGAASGTLRHVITDPVTGYVYASFEHTAIFGSYCYVFRSQDHGDTWTPFVAQAVSASEGIFSLDAYNHVVALRRRYGYTTSQGALMSADDGETWSVINLGNYGWSGTHRIAPLGEGLIYGYDPTVDMASYGIGFDTTVILDDLNLNPYGAGGYWFDADDAQHMAIYQYNGGFYETTDGWATATLYEASVTAPLEQFAEGCEAGAYVLGRTTGTGWGLACVRVGDTLVADDTVDRSGPNNGTSPYADSIPGNCNGLVDRGLWVVGSEPGHWRVYSCAFQEDGE